ncbi:hypothetical protein [Caloramator australicus]|uniref:Uncharacterized protein n=1 Tax=Caloramator australicus RC3 TaxID=857293 RepID=I7K5S2_9CLOT|nr:hypothetical protein [Caloramator australicus]CCJ32869.1 hypothetical protein CAAU_0785 [Caloramator australicus RC3]
MDKQKVLTKDEFVRRLMSDMAKKRRERIRQAKEKESDIYGVIMDNHYRIERYLKHSRVHRK